MTIQFYVATSLSGADRAREVRDLMTRRGRTITFDWMDAPALHPEDPRVSPDDETLPDGSVEDLALRASDDARGVYEADLVVAIMPGGIGTHVELGIALGRKLGRASSGPVVVLWIPPGVTVDDPYPCVFHHHPSLLVVEGTIGDLVVAVENALARYKAPGFTPAGGAS